MRNRGGEGGRRKGELENTAVQLARQLVQGLNLGVFVKKKSINQSKSEKDSVYQCSELYQKLLGLLGN